MEPPARSPDTHRSGAPPSVEGAEIEAAVLFAGITEFSNKTAELTPTETQVYVQNFLAWITAEALDGRAGIVEKYAGDEVMVVYATDFGSDDPFTDAVQAAIAIVCNDFLAFHPRIGIASGPVTGYIGAALRYDTTALEAVVALAARCASVKPNIERRVPSTIVMTAREWDNRDIHSTIPLVVDEGPMLDVRDSRTVSMEGIGEVEVREIYNASPRLPRMSAEDRAIAALKFLQESGRNWPRRHKL